MRSRCSTVFSSSVTTKSCYLKHEVPRIKLRKASVNMERHDSYGIPAVNFHQLLLMKKQYIGLKLSDSKSIKPEPSHAMYQNKHDGDRASYVDIDQSSSRFTWKSSGCLGGDTEFECTNMHVALWIGRDEFLGGIWFKCNFVRVCESDW